MHRFPFSMMSEKQPAAESFPAPVPPGYSAVEHDIFSSLGPPASSSWERGMDGAGSSIPGVKYPTAEAQREPGLSLGPNCLFVGASFCFSIQGNCPQGYMLGGTVGLGSQRYKSITEINVFQEQFSATLLFFYRPCNKPVFRRFLNPCCEALSSCNLGAN